MPSAHAQSDDRQHDQPKAEAAQPAKPANDNKEGFFAWAERIVINAAQSIAEDRTIPAIGREAIKDIRSTYQYVFFDQHEQGGEPGAPLNPLPSEIAAATVANDQQHDPLPYGFSQSGVNYSMPSPSDIAYDRHKIDNPQNARNQPNGQVLEQKSWEQKEQERQQNKSGYDRQKERILPEEERQKEREQEQERGGRCR